MERGFYVYLREPAPNKAGYLEKRWRITRGRLPQNQYESNWGKCDYETRTITIHTPLSVEDFWSTLWHEVLHAVQPDAAEHVILRAEHGLRAASIKAGLFKESDE